jgi:molecular chaperone DnaK
VKAKDKGTGKEHGIRIEASTGLSKEEVEKMKNEAKANEDRDKKEREKVDKLNQADSLIFQTEKQMTEIGDKIPADLKTPIENALVELKAAHQSQNIDAVDEATKKLNEAWSAASQAIYAAQQQAGGDQAQADAGGATEGATAGNNDNVTDAEFEEVK